MSFRPPARAAVLAVALGCDLDSLHIGVDGATADVLVPPPADADGGDAGPAPDACVPRTEVCNQADDDCNGAVDDGFNLDADPENCGECGNACNRPNALGTCVGGDCSYACAPCAYDLDGDLDDPSATNGCEYECCPSADGLERCDFADNDCDGEVDEGFATGDDIDNCGGCGQVCLALNAEPACVGGECTYTTCFDGFGDILPGVAGCEYACPVFPPVPEACNYMDDDCDGILDDGDPEGGAPCGETTGECAAGTVTCVFGTLVCVGDVGPVGETCNILDDDCDGIVDDGFDFLFDPATCGGCAPCDLPFAVEGCSFGACTVVSCLFGYLDSNGDPADGCEYACTPAGPEVCDGQDNDCDTLIDGLDGDMLPAVLVCDPDGACAGTTPVCAPSPCDTTPAWRCPYPAGVETDACGAIVLDETVCDSLDNDCDGAADDSFPLKGTPCDDGEIGLCRGTGAFDCNAAGDGLECVITAPGADPAPADTACDGVDEDCDGSLDEDVADPMVPVGAGPDFWIYPWEASRPGATAAGPGVLEHRPCAQAGVLPWRSLTWTEANELCAGVGLRLCTEAEWQQACAGSPPTAYPYGPTYVPTACNGADYDPAADEVLPTGSAAACESDWGALDMSGNLREWTATQVGTSPGGAGIYRVRGGAYDNVAPALTCDYDFLAFVETFLFPNLGFRCCCDSTMPGCPP